MTNEVMTRTHELATVPFSKLKLELIGHMANTSNTEHLLDVLLQSARVLHERIRTEKMRGVQVAQED